MRAVILAGGYGTRLAEETDVKPKPMVEIGGMPILWHILKHFAHHGVREFYIALGYKGEIIKKFFMDFYRLNGSVTLNLATGDVMGYHRPREDWMMHLVDTGKESMTGGRLLRLRQFLQGEPFIVTYGDGVSNVDIRKLIECHHANGKLATLTAVRPPARFGGLLLDGQVVREFTEKPQTGEGWINGGYIVLEPEIFKYFTDDSTVLETQVLERAAADGQLAAYCHDDFWQCMDTVRDVRMLNTMWRDGNPPWKVWSDNGHE
jgi:glucose-1-phosphate cytidylyltransferase